MRILIAGAQKHARQSLMALLRASLPQSEIHEAAGFREAVRIAGEVLPRLVILDVPAPDIEELAAAREIHCRSPDTRILFLTLYPSGFEQARAAGADALVTKGESPARLLSALSSLLQTPPRS